MITIKEAYDNYKFEAEKYFITKFIDSPKIEKIISSCLNVLLRIDNVEIPKGLLLYSKSFGQGKTLFFDIFFHRVFRVNKRKAWRKYTAKQLCEIYAKDGVNALNRAIDYESIFIDDLGEEEPNRKHYGDEINVLKNVLSKRYELWLEKHYTTHITTNLSIVQIAEIYGGRVSDRLIQMTERIEFDFVDGSFRQTNESRVLSESEKPKQKKKESVVDLKKKEAEYWNYLNELSKDYRENNDFYIHWSDFRIMYDFFVGVGYKFPEPDEKDFEIAGVFLQTDKSKGGTEVFNAKKSLLKNKSVGDFEKAQVLKAVIAKRLFTKLAESNHFFSETNNLPEL